MKSSKAKTTSTRTPVLPVATPLKTKPKYITIKNNLPQLLTLVVGGRGIELPARGERKFPEATKLGADVSLKLRRKMITVYAAK